MKKTVQLSRSSRQSVGPKCACWTETYFRWKYCCTWSIFNRSETWVILRSAPGPRDWKLSISLIVFFKRPRVYLLQTHQHQTLVDDTQQIMESLISFRVTRLLVLLCMIVTYFTRSGLALDDPMELPSANIVHSHKNLGDKCKRDAECDSGECEWRRCVCVEDSDCGPDRVCIERIILRNICV